MSYVYYNYDCVIATIFPLSGAVLKTVCIRSDNHKSRESGRTQANQMGTYVNNAHYQTVSSCFENV